MSNIKKRVTEPRRRHKTSAGKAKRRRQRPAISDRRHATEQRLVAAARALISESGFQSVRINRVAKKAGVPKQLIYRYFGGVSDLILAAVDSKDFWLPERITPYIESLAGKSFEEKVSHLVLAHARSMRGDIEAKEIRRYEMMSEDALAAMLAKHREQGGKIIGRLLEGAPPIDAAVFGLIFAGISYLILREKTLPSYIGISIRGEDAWPRWENAALEIVRMVCKAAGRP